MFGVGVGDVFGNSSGSDPDPPGSPKRERGRSESLPRTPRKDKGKKVDFGDR